MTLLLPWSIMGTQMVVGISLQRQVIANQVGGKCWHQWQDIVPGCLTPPSHIYQWCLLQATSSGLYLYSNSSFFFNSTCIIVLLSMLRENNIKTSPDRRTGPGAETDVCCCSSRMGGHIFSVFNITPRSRSNSTELEYSRGTDCYYTYRKIGTQAGSTGPCHWPSKWIPLQLCYTVELELAAVWTLLLFLHICQ